MENGQNNTAEDWEINIRTDMWNDMTVSQLNVQRELILDKISLLYSSPQMSQTVVDIISALNLGLEDVSKLIDYNENRNKTQRVLL